jgi:hypothetical protein
MFNYDTLGNTELHDEHVVAYVWYASEWFELDDEPITLPTFGKDLDDMEIPF